MMVRQLAMPIQRLPLAENGAADNRLDAVRANHEVICALRPIVEDHERIGGLLLNTRNRKAVPDWRLCEGILQYSLQRRPRQRKATAALSPERGEIDFVDQPPAAVENLLHVDRRGRFTTPGDDAELAQRPDRIARKVHAGAPPRLRRFALHYFEEDIPIAKRRSRGEPGDIRADDENIRAVDTRLVGGTSYPARIASTLQNHHQPGPR